MRSTTVNDVGGSYPARCGATNRTGIHGPVGWSPADSAHAAIEPERSAQPA